ncbi:hypothetical protein BXT86_01990 [candidate division WOR-3 bacterium 4484_100]|uniref:Transcriptional repressor n=1 Tax=candidate division WOR-3 bacterium 4484_100 TaxID=1936077 RepID=A0A1V4QG11_UNCW3|nr:MAG: hypothetical protein BXT86_01990 [candidate division WOR-3 bacterium 4484_100]
MKIIPSLEKLKTELIARGLKPTFQRLKVLEYLKQNKTHPTAEIIYEHLSRKIPTMSITTIYNTLNIFLKKGLLSAITITGKEIRYDYNSSPHHHFLCTHCGRIIDINLTCPYTDGKKKVIAGHRIEEVHGYFKGICKDCLKKEAKQKKSNNV